MSVSKKALMIGIGSTIAIGGITTAIAVPLSQSQKQTINTISASTLTSPTTIQNLLDEIKQEDIVVLAKKQTPDTALLIRKNLTETKDANVIDRNSVYAFDLDNTQFALKQEVKNKFKTFSDVTFSFHINNEANNSVELNKGNVAITLKATINNNEVGKVDLNLTNFKSISTNLTGVLKNDSKTNKVVLDLINSQKDKTLKTIEQLNAKTPSPLSEARRGARRVNLHDESTPVLVSENGISGLSALLHTITAGEKEDKDLKDWTVEGNVKLERISTDNKTTFFHLVSSNETKLKLVKTNDKGAKQEALIDEVKVTNLLASSIKFVPSNIEEEHQKAYLTKFETDAMSKGFKGEKDKGFHLEVKKTPSGPEEAVNVTINPYNIDRKEEKQDLLVNLEINFGSKENIKTYKTTEAKDLAELKNGGFNLSIYSKNLKVEDELVMATKIFDYSDTNKLASYFIKDGLTTPVKKTDIEMETRSDDSMTKVPVGGFSLVSSSTSNYNNGFNLGQVTTIKENMEHGKHKSQSDTKNVDWVVENWISFVGYTYNGLIKDNEQAILFIPTINLLHIKEPVAEMSLGVDGGK